MQGSWIIYTQQGITVSAAGQVFQAATLLRANRKFWFKGRPFIFLQGMKVITFSPLPGYSQNLAFLGPVHPSVLGWCVEGFHKEMFFSKKCIQSVEGNKLVCICGFCKIRKVCSQPVLMRVQTWLTCHLSQSLPTLPQFLWSYTVPRSSLSGLAGMATASM